MSSTSAWTTLAAATALFDDLTGDAARSLGMPRMLVKAAAAALAVKLALRLVNRASRGEDSGLPRPGLESERAVRAHMAAVTQRYIYMAEHVEEEYFSDRGLALKIPKGATIVDVGAHFGLFTMSCFAKSGFTSRHFCFEPVPKIRAVCNATMAGLDPAGDRIKVFPYGLSDREGQVEFTYVAACPELSGYKDVDFERDVNMATATQIDRYYDPDCPEYFRKAIPSMFKYLPRFIGAPLLGLMYDMVMASRPATELVQCKLRRLSDVLAGQEVGPTIDVLKIDVEGAELDVLRGISAEDWAKVQVAAIEVHDKNGNLAPVRAILRANGLTDIVEEQDLITKPLKIWQILARRKQPSAGGAI